MTDLANDGILANRELLERLAFDRGSWSSNCPTGIRGGGDLFRLQRLRQPIGGLQDADPLAVGEQEKLGMAAA